MSGAKEQNNKRSNGKGAGPTRSFNGSVLEPGGRIGPFRITQELGRGGAGVVYLAHDTKLHRPVAIKSLPPELIENPKARTRFAREARVLASLNHPNIATIYEELQEAEGVAYLVLEYVPGQTLAERITHARLKPQEALAIAQQIAEAVAAAHEHEVIHRDLKPGNIKITPEGRIKVLDFGLAKALGAEAADPLITVTELGHVVGTPAYMSPEQARGLETDKRCDIWAFGCVLYEMLTGRLPFEGDTISDTVASILDREPDWHALPQATPANIRVLLRRCLEKDPHRRLHDIADAWIEISETLSGSVEVFALPGKVAPVSQLFRRNIILACLACLIAGVLITGIIVYLIWPTPERPVVSRTSIEIPAEKPLYTGIAPNCFLAISPDGTRLVYVGDLDNRNTELYMRSLDDLEIKPIPGTRNAHNPFFSPNGQWVGFFTEPGLLKKVSLAGGEPLPLLEDIQLGQVAFGSWADDGTIVFSVPGGNRGLQRIPDKGAQQAEPLMAPSPEDGEVCYCYPQVLPGGDAILYSRVYSDGSRTPRIEAFLRETGKRQAVLNDASYATYVSSGHLIFVQDNVLMAAPFDVERLEITGPLVPLVEDDVAFDYGGETPQITISRNGTVVYIRRSKFRENELVWVDRRGISESLDARADVYGGPRLSPDGQRIAVTIQSQKEFASQVYVYRLERGAPTHLTTKGENRYAQWSPDGTEIAFWSNRTEGAGVFCKVVGTGASAELLASEPSPGVFLFPYSWSHSRNLLACTVLDPNTREDIYIVDPNGDQELTPFLRTEYREYNPTLSPDGRWLAYVSEETGQPEIYVRGYPDAEPKEMVSIDAGSGINPAWQRDRNGRELYYINGDTMRAVTVTSEPSLVLGAPEQLFKLPDGIVPGSYLGRNYDVSDDGRFLMMKWSDDTKDQLIVVQNWFEELKRLAPPGRNR